MQAFVDQVVEIEMQTIYNGRSLFINMKYLYLHTYLYCIGLIKSKNSHLENIDMAVYI